MIRLAVAGANGRMGRCVVEAAGQDPCFSIVAALVAPRNDASPRTVARVGEREMSASERLNETCDVLVEFAGAEGSIAWLEVCQKRNIPLVMGSTGHSESQLSMIRSAGEIIPIVKSANFSVGIQLLVNCVTRLREALSAEYDVEVVETHHRHKVDAPSGTAHLIVDAILSADASSSGGDRSDIVLGRGGRSSDRPRGQIGIHSLRMGEIVGQHEIHFSGPGETLSVRHVAHSREAFARGALRAAQWVLGKRPGMYSMRDLIGTSSGTEP